MEWLFLWGMMGVIVAMVANSKGGNPVLWFLYGAVIWPVALTHALLMKRQD